MKKIVNKRKFIFSTLFFILAFILMFVKFIYINADPPSGISTSGDLFTDEGWYSINSVNKINTGVMHKDGEFNPAVNYPIVPLLQIFTFKIFGVGIVQIRIINVLISILLILLAVYYVRRYVSKNASIIMFILLTTNFYFFAFSRIALLEIPMTFFVLLSIGLGIKYYNSEKRIYLLCSSLSSVIALLTKGSSIFLFAVMFYILLKKKKGLRKIIIDILIFYGVSLSLYGLYFYFYAKLFLADFNYFNSLSISNKLKTDIITNILNIKNACKSIICINKYFSLLFLTMLIVITLIIKYTRKNKLIQVCVIWIILQLIMIGLNGYFPERYFVPLVIPLFVLVSSILDFFITRNYKHKKIALIFVIPIFLSVAQYSYKMYNYFSNLHYSFKDMCTNISIYTKNSDSNYKLVGSIANSIGLWNNCKTVNANLGYKSLDFRIKKYQPQYFIQFPGEREEDINTLLKYYNFQYIKSYNVYNNYYYNRQPVKLYRLIKK